LRQENARGKNVRVAIAENGLKLFDRPQRAPNARRQPGEADRFCSKLSGNFSMSMKYFNTPGTLPLYSGVTTCSPADCNTASAKGRNDFGFSA